MSRPGPFDDLLQSLAGQPPATVPVGQLTLARLRAELQHAAKHLTGESARVFWKMFDEVLALRPEQKFCRYCMPELRCCMDVGDAMAQQCALKTGHTGACQWPDYSR